MDASGNFIVSWQSNGGGSGGWNVLSQRYNAAGLAQGGEFSINTVTFKDQTNPAVAMDATGNYVVAWQSAKLDYPTGEPSDAGIYAQRFNSAGVAIGGQFLVNTTIAGSKQNASVAMDDSLAARQVTEYLLQLGHSRIAHIGGHPDHAALLGLLAGTGFGLAAIGIRAATQSLGDSPAFVRAIVALAVMNTIQTVIHGGYLAVRERAQIGLAFRHWRSSSVVGVLSVCGSACWAWAFALQNAARVRTFGQIELLFTFAVAHWWLRERNTRREYAGAALVLVGVIGVMLAG